MCNAILSTVLFRRLVFDNTDNCFSRIGNPIIGNCLNCKWHWNFFFGQKGRILIKIKDFFVGAVWNIFDVLALTRCRRNCLQRRCAFFSHNPWLMLPYHFCLDQNCRAKKHLWVYMIRTEVIRGKLDSSNSHLKQFYDKYYVIASGISTCSAFKLCSQYIQVLFVYE